MDLPIRMRITYNVKYRYPICLDFGEKFSTSQTKLVLELNAEIWSTIKENLLLYCRNFWLLLSLSYRYISLFVVVNIFLQQKAVSQRNTACNGNH